MLLSMCVMVARSSTSRFGILGVGDRAVWGPCFHRRGRMETEKVSASRAGRL